MIHVYFCGYQEFKLPLLSVCTYAVVLPDSHWIFVAIFLSLVRSIFKDDWRLVEKPVEVGVSPRTLAQIQGDVDAEKVEDIRVAVGNDKVHLYSTSHYGMPRKYFPCTIIQTDKSSQEKVW